jgi:hypothetical protein
VSAAARRAAWAVGGALALALVVERWPRWGGALLVCVVASMLVHGAQRGEFPANVRA